MEPCPITKKPIGKFDYDNPLAKQIILGSFIQTNRGYYYLSVSLGKIACNGQWIQSISVESPLGRSFLGKIVNRCNSL
jgi:hypothetical protein